MSDGNFAWLLPVWLIGAPFVLGLVELFRVSQSETHRSAPPTRA